MSLSIETRAVAALAAVQQIGDDMLNDHPMRHQVRHLKRQAVQILDEAFSSASVLAYIAKSMAEDHDKAVRDAIVEATGDATSSATPQTDL